MVGELISEFVEGAEGCMTVAREVAHIGSVETIQHISTAVATGPPKEVKTLSVSMAVQ